MVNCSEQEDAKKIENNYMITFSRNGVEVYDTEGGPHWYTLKIWVEEE